MLVEQMRVGPMAVFSYIVGCENKKEGLIIDPAGSERRILSKAEDMGLRIKYVINTHGHADHTCGNRAVLSKTGADLVVHREDASEILRGLNRAFSVVMGKRPSPRAQRLVTDGDFIRIGKTGLKVIHTPGHTPGSICLYGEGNLFTGDTLFIGAVGRTDLRGGSFDVLLDSLRKLLSLPPETRVWPGHDYGDAPVSTLAREKETNPYITDFLQ
ncbi:MAG: MBL fold metallo-hydrolase [Deltaproteobacteria bacterium]|nr:MBL fold metallo-hydrolase [Deltaproteobacteria bacterium]